MTLTAEWLGLSCEASSLGLHSRELAIIYDFLDVFLLSLLMPKIVHTINHENLAGGTFWNGNFDILIVFTLWKLRIVFRSDFEA